MFSKSICGTFEMNDFNNEMEIAKLKIVILVLLKLKKKKLMHTHIQKTKKKKIKNEELNAKLKCNFDLMPNRLSLMA